MARLRRASAAESPTVRDARRAFVVATVVLLVLRQTTSIDGRRLAAAYLAAVAAIAVVLLVRLTAGRHAATPSRFDRAVAGTTVAPVPPSRQLRDARRAMASAVESAGGAHGSLRPLLVEVAAERLEARHGIGLDDPRAVDHVGPALWELVRPDRQPPRERRGPGLGREKLEQVMAELEAVT